MTTPPRYRRKLRNFLLNVPLQLKLTAYALAATLTISAFLGVFLWHEVKTVLRSADVMTEQRLKAAQANRELARSSLAAKISDIGNMDWAAAGSHLKAINDRYQAEVNETQREHAELIANQVRVIRTIAAGLLAFLVSILVGSIVATHRIAGPLYRMGQLTEQITFGKLRVPNRSLRSGDQLKDFFAGFTSMIETLRAREIEELAAWDMAIDLAEKVHAPAEKLLTFRAIRSAKRDRLDLQKPTALAVEGDASPVKVSGAV